VTESIHTHKEIFCIGYSRIFNITEVLTASITRSHPKSSPLSARRCVWKGDPSARLGSGSGEMLCTWARDYGVIGTAST